MLQQRGHDSVCLRPAGALCSFGLAASCLGAGESVLLSSVLGCLALGSLAG